jgi:beta-glucosidase
VRYGSVTLSSPTMDWDGTLTASVELTNTGERAVEETVQLYIHDRVASLTQPGQLLRDFRKVRLAPGATQTISFTLRREQLAFVHADLSREAEPGTFRLWLAPSAQAGTPVEFTLRR